MKPIFAGAAFAALLILSGCATKPIPYDRTSAKDNRTIGLLTPAWPSGPASVLASNVGQSFGLVGALVNAAMQADREKELTKLLNDQKVDANTLFVTSLKAELEKEGYAVVAVPADQKRGNFIKKYALGGAPVDSYLDVVTLGYGYMASGTGNSTPYRPAVAARVKLVRASDGAILMQDQVAYNPVGPVGAANNTVTLSPDPAYAFVRWSDVTSDPQKAAAGVTSAVDLSARAVGDLLK